MSKIALSGNPSGTGTFTIASPNSNTDRTLTLPDATGTVVTKSSTYIAPSELGAGTANNTTFLRGDSTWQTVPTPTIASTAEAQAGTNNTNFITPLRLFQAFQGSNFSAATNGYQILPSGLIIQWGSVVVPYSQQTASVTFPIAFTSNVVSVQATAKSFSANGVVVPSITSSSTTGITIYGDFSSGTVSADTFWLAVGY